MANNPSNPPDWEALSKRPEFRELIAAKKRFIIPYCIFFVIYYFLFLYLVGWHPEIVKKQVWGKVNIAYLYALSQFFMAWTLAWIYVRKSAQFDRQAAEVIKNETH